MKRRKRGGVRSEMRRGDRPGRPAARSAAPHTVSLATLPLAVLTTLAGLGCDDGGTGPGEATLRERALDAGLAAAPTEPPRPLENPYSEARVELGHLLFFDPILSGPKDVACSTCHLPRFGFGDGRQFPAGAGAEGLGPDRTEPGPPPLRLMPRNSPTVLNAGLFGRMDPDPSINGTMFWGGNAFGIEDQALAPLAADTEMRGLTYERMHAQDSVLARLRDIAGYMDRFAVAFPDLGTDPVRLVNATTLRRAIAAYVRELVTPAAPLDRFLDGDASALTTAQKEGLDLFIGKAGCSDCHTGPLLSDFDFYVIGAPQEGIGRDSTPGDDLGWGEHGGELYAFRTPPLRQVSLTAPYFHAGTHPTLRAVLEFKNRGESGHPNVPDAALADGVEPLGLTDAEMDRLVDFLGAVTDTETTSGPLFQAPDSVPSGLEPPH